MMREEIVITFDAESPAVQVEAVGVRGKSCTKLTQPFEEALGIAGGQRKLKAEYYAPEVKAGVKVGGGG